jgi:hypothetical protein
MRPLQMKRIVNLQAVKWAERRPTVRKYEFNPAGHGCKSADERDLDRWTLPEYR